LLPADAYWSRSWFAAEQEQLFRRCWNLVGTVDDLEESGALVADVAGTAVCSDVDAMLQLSRTIIEVEDGAACEALQAAVRSPAFAVGPMARDHERPIARFHQEILRTMGDAPHRVFEMAR